MSPKVAVGLSIAWNLKTSALLHRKIIKNDKELLGFTSSFFVVLWGFIATLRRVLAMVCFFIPSLGLVNLLNHWLAEQYPFSIRSKFNLIHPRDEFYLYNLTGNWFWKDLDRWNYYASPEEPSPPSYALYTGFTLQNTFIEFFLLMALHCLTMATVKMITSPEFRKEKGFFNKSLHILQNINIAYPFRDWDYGFFTIDEYKRRFQSTEKEMMCSILLNNLFSLAMVGPIWYAGGENFKTMKYFHTIFF